MYVSSQCGMQAEREKSRNLCRGSREQPKASLGGLLEQGLEHYPRPNSIHSAHLLLKRLPTGWWYPGNICTHYNRKKASFPHKKLIETLINIIKKKSKEMIVDLQRSGQCDHPSLDIKRGGSGVRLQLSVPEPDSDRGSILGHQHSLCHQKKPNDDSSTSGSWGEKKLPQKLLVNFYHCAAGSALTYCVSARCSSCTKAE